MLKPDQPIAIYLEGNLAGENSKMGFGVLRYSPNPIACVIDSTFAGRNAADIVASPRSVPVVASLTDARALGAEVLILGIAPPGGLIPDEWMPDIREAVELGFSIVNGLHDLLSPKFSRLAAGQWIWDIRVEPAGLQPAQGACVELANRRLLMVGTDMAIGKMTAGLEIELEARKRGVKTAFIATGQIGVTITGRGIPLDAIRVDFAAGALEREVLAVRDAELVIVEGQGSLVHPGSIATLPLLRGSMPTHLVLCHRAGQDTLGRLAQFRIPSLSKLLDLYCEVAEVFGTFPRPKPSGVCLNTSQLPEEDARQELSRIEEETGLPCEDPIRFGVSRIVDDLLA